MTEAIAVAATAASRTQLVRQVEHWAAAVEQLSDLEQQAPAASWRALERYLGRTLETTLQTAIGGLRKHARVLRAQIAAGELTAELERVRRDILAFRRRYLAVETVVDFYADAVNARAGARLSEYLQACDFLAFESMRALLEPLGRPTPRALCYVDKGLGASILKAGLRLWDGRSMSPVAAVKIVRHNLLRPTALVHEVGHQVAHEVGWVDELSRSLAAVAPGSLGGLWAGWASEIAADAFAFVHTGFASLAALHDVLSGEADWVLRVDHGDPHPTGYLRVRLGHEICRRFYGAGPWDALAEAWQQSYPLADAAPGAAELFAASSPVLPRIVQVVFETPYRAFGGRSLVGLLDPARVKPEALLALERDGGRALYQSSDWLRREALRLLALSGYRAAVEPERTGEIVAQQEAWMRRLGALVYAA